MDSFHVTIRQGATQEFASILLTDRDDLKLNQECIVEQQGERSDEYTTMYIRNLQQLGCCSQLANYRFVVFGDNHTKVLIEGSSTNLRSLESLLFESMDRGGTYCLTSKGKYICEQLLLGYKELENHKIYFSKGNYPENILFLQGDQDHLYPKITNFYDDKFVEVDSTNNYNKLWSLLEALLGDRLADSSLKSFLENTSMDYHLVVNHPALWRKDSPYFFALEAATYIKRNPENQLFYNEMEWKNKLGQSLFDYYERAVDKRKKIHKDTNGEYENNVKGSILFKRDTFVHYNENKKSTDSKMSILKIEKWFNKSMPEFNSTMYHHMKLCGFQFRDKPRRFS